MIYVDRSRYTEGLAHCQQARYLAYHHNGTGLSRKRRSMPLATGIYVHAAVNTLVRSVITLDGQIPDRDWVRPALAAIVNDYRDHCINGYLNDNPDSDMDWVMDEQSCLIEGMGWAFWKHWLPHLLKDFEFIDCESEETLVMDCTCGVGNQTLLELHKDDCQGICWMSKPDAIIRRKDNGQLGILDWKTLSNLDSGWASQWQDNLQMAVSGLGVEKRLGEPVTHYWIVGFNKGMRRKGFNSSTSSYDGPREQGSILCYAYCKEPTPPLDPQGDWQPKYNYYDDTSGKNRRLPNYYQKMGIWRGTFHGKPSHISNSEWWVCELLEPHYAFELVSILGPYEQHGKIAAQFLKEMPAHEQEWKWRLEDPENRIYRSWACHSYGHPCIFRPICYGEYGAEEHYQVRQPHHSTEEVEE